MPSTSQLSATSLGTPAQAAPQLDDHPVPVRLPDRHDPLRAARLEHRQRVLHHVGVPEVARRRPRAAVTGPVQLQRAPVRGRQQGELLVDPAAVGPPGKDSGTNRGRQ